jgi:Cohesin loading factor
MDLDLSQQLSLPLNGRFHLTTTAGPLSMEWFTQSEMYVFGYLISGAVNLAESGTGKTGNFLNEGIVVVDRTPLCRVKLSVLGMLKYEKFGVGGWLFRCGEQHERLLRLKRYAVLYISFAHLLRSNWSLAEGYMQSLHEDPSDATFQALYSLLQGVYCHFRGELSGALTHYTKITPTAPPEIYLLTLLNRSLLPTENRDKILEHVEHLILRQGVESFPHLRTALLLIKGIFTPELLKSGYVRRLLGLM